MRRSGRHRRSTRLEIRPTPEFFSATFDTRAITVLGSIDGLKLILPDIEKLMTGADMALVETAAH